MRKAVFGSLFRMERIPLRVDATAEYRQIGIRSHGKGIFYRDAVPGDGLSKLAYFHVKPGRIVFSNIMAWEGAVGITGPEAEGTVGSQRFLSYEPVSEDVDLAYVNYFFQSDGGGRLLGGGSTGTVKRNQTLSPRTIEAFNIPLPPIGEQRRIADILDRIMGVVAYSAGVQDLEAATHAALLRSSFSLGVRPLRKLGAIMSPADVAVDVQGDQTYRLAGVYSFGRGLIDRGAIRGSETKYRSLNRLSRGSIVFAKLNAWEGALALVPAEFDGYYVSPEFPVLTLDESNCDRAYLRHVLTWPSLWDQMAPRGSMIRRKRTTTGTFLAAEVPMPSVAEQRRISSTLDKFAEVAARSERARSLAKGLRESALNAAFSGEL